MDIQTEHLDETQGLDPEILNLVHKHVFVVREINLLYGSLAHRLGEHLPWAPDAREDGSPIWMSVMAEGWQPKDREFEWVMVGPLAAAF